MNNRIKFGSHVKLSVCLLALLVASESLIAKKIPSPDGSITAEHITTTLQPKRNAGKVFKETLSALKDENHSNHAIVKNSLSTPENFKNYTQHLSLSNVLSLAKMDPTYKSFAVVALLGSRNEKHIQYAGFMASEIFNDAGAAQHHESVKEALLAYFKNAHERVLPLERVQTFMGKGEALNFWGSLYLFKSDDTKKHTVAEEKLLGALKDSNHPYHQFTKTQLQDHLQNTDKRIIPLKTVKKIFEEAPDLTLSASLYLFKSDDSKKHVVGIEKLKEIFSNPQHLNHSEARDVLGSANEFEKITKKLSKKQQDELLKLLSTKTAEAAIPSAEEMSQQFMNVSLNPKGSAANVIQVLNQPITQEFIPQAVTVEQKVMQMGVENYQADFSDVLKKTGINQTLNSFVSGKLNSFSSERQSLLFQHLESRNPTNGYELSMAFESFKKESSSLTQEEKNLLDTMAWNLDPQY
ncbi:MAG: hypothetical protein ACRCUQ_05800 [Alphaproteobacteria bacterium]